MRWNRVLAAIELLVAAAAVYGGVGLAWDNRLGMLDSWLAGSPFHSWLWPGVLLLLVVAAPMTVAAVLELRASPWAAPASLAAGGAQVAWIAAQLYVFQLYHVLQPVMLGFGLLVMALALWAHRTEPALGPVARLSGRDLVRGRSWR
ncbi:hypothetical protein ACIB24_10045 [Spongisporangium articulatum]|uniref:Uncharacterized protein n=1 Tax=Spongisporangium articulatum TaxID=3362603 RepID=A0ABW8AMT6_9ACTN